LGQNPDDDAETRLRTVQLPNGEVLRPFDLSREDAGQLLQLKESVYAKRVSREVFDWEYLRHPRREEIRVFVVERGGVVVASTTRLPATLRANGVDSPVFFNIDSMVHPAHRRRGFMRDLYRFAREQLGGGAAFFSKGSSTHIYPLLMSIGHREILPNTYLVSYPSAARWLMSRLHLHSPSPQAHRAALVGFDDFHPIDRFGPDFDAYFERVSRKLSVIFCRDAAFMSWRYLGVPHRRYLCFKRTVGDQIVSVVVVALNGDQGQVVDLLWDLEHDEEPERTVRFTQALFDEHEVVRVSCFATHPRLRETLLRSGFVDRGDTPQFSAFFRPGYEAAFAPGSELHVVDGDGDTEFS
jgi:GNAT superfamily N-acetyltransferase